MLCVEPVEHLPVRQLPSAAGAVVVHERGAVPCSGSLYVVPSRRAPLEKLHELLHGVSVETDARAGPFLVGHVQREQPRHDDITEPCHLLEAAEERRARIAGGVRVEERNRHDDTTDQAVVELGIECGDIRLAPLVDRCEAP